MRPFTDDAELATTRRILVHVQSHAGPVMKLYLWDQAAVDFCKKFKSSDNTPFVILVTTVYPKRLGEIFSYMKQGAVKVYKIIFVSNSLFNIFVLILIAYTLSQDAFFVCTATIDDVVHDSPWYYIACGGCKTKATKGPTSLMCAKCGKNDVAGEPQPMEIKKMDSEVPVPQVLLNTIGQTHKFNVKVSEHNFSGRTRVITVTNVLSPSAPPSTQDPVADQISGSGNGTLATGYDVIEPSKSPQDSEEVGLKRMGDGVEIGNAKRSKDVN
ncbi:unnamed protein product [Brassica napus]|uniref:(rape) hypothetical protein n=1 Tax=Brassica napus TaxID=3708 RepID=A0A816P1M2_BRANA|nr:unnamed protein product [Brassica napus]